MGFHSQVGFGFAAKCVLTGNHWIFSIFGKSKYKMGTFVEILKNKGEEYDLEIDGRVIHKK